MDIDETGLGGVPAPFFIERKIEIMKWEKFSKLADLTAKSEKHQKRFKFGLN